MNIKNRTAYVAMAIGLGMAPVLPSFSAFAQIKVQTPISVSASATVASPDVNVKVSATVAKLIANGQAKANSEITRRVDALNALNARVQSMQKLSANDKSNLSASIQSQLSALATLKTQIQTDASADDTSSLKADIKSITGSYRIFALVIPQGRIEAAADRVADVADILQTLSGKLQIRISDAQASSTAADTALADMNAKIADARSKTQAAVTEVISLQPDNGSTTLMASNTATLKDARTKIQAAQKDLLAARADVNTILKALKISTSVNATTSATTSAR